MPLRKFAAAPALGLLGALAVHAVAFGGGHALGGTYAALLAQLAAAALGALLLGGLSFALTGTRGTADGSVLAARLERLLPGALPMALWTLAWFLAGERLEPEHAAASPLILLLAAGAATALVRTIARIAIACLAGAALAIARASAFQPRTPSWRLAFAGAAALLPASPVRRRRFARPPPASAFARA